jgi:hypothetical protein
LGLFSVFDGVGLDDGHRYAFYVLNNTSTPCCKNKCLGKKELTQTWILIISEHFQMMQDMDKTEKKKLIR